MTFTIEIDNAARLRQVLRHGGGGGWRALGAAALKTSDIVPCYNRSVSDTSLGA